jgi:hypothetical protein
VSGIRQDTRPEGDRRAEGYPAHRHHRPPQLEPPEQVTLAVAELAGAAREGLLALAVGTGLQVLQTLQTLLAADVARLVGARPATTPTAPPRGMAATPAR